MSHYVAVEYHVLVNVPRYEIENVKEWMERFGYLLGDGWAFNQTVQEWVTINGMSDWEWREAQKGER